MRHLLRTSYETERLLLQVLDKTHAESVSDYFKRNRGFYNEGLATKYLKINGKWEDHIHMVLLNDKV